MTEYDYSPEAYERYLATQNRIAKWVDDTEQHRSEYEHAVPNKASSARYEALKSRKAPHRKRRLCIDPPPDSDTSDSEHYAAIPGPMPLSAPLPYAAPHSPFYLPATSPVAPVGQYLLSPPVVPRTYATAPQNPYINCRPGSHYRSPLYVPSPQHSRAYYNVASTPQASPGQHLYPPVATKATYPVNGYIIVPQQSPYRYKTMPPAVINTLMTLWVSFGIVHNIGISLSQTLSTPHLLPSPGTTMYIPTVPLLRPLVQRSFRSSLVHTQSTLYSRSARDIRTEFPHFLGEESRRDPSSTERAVSDGAVRDYR